MKGRGKKIGTSSRGLGTYLSRVCGISGDIDQGQVERVLEIHRVVIIVIDGLGIGALPDAAEYGDTGAHTLDNTARAVGGLGLPTLQSLGLGLVEGVEEIERTPLPRGAYGRMQEASPGKDTLTGHREMMGVILEAPYPTFPEGFPRAMMEEFRDATGREWLYGKPASGTEIIERLGPEHMASGKLIVYTSADSVFQIAAHEDVVPVEELYDICAKARSMLNKYGLERVIARPFTGRPGAFSRTPRRRDFALPPKRPILLEMLAEKGLPVIGIGKIGDIFSHRGLTEEVHTRSDAQGMDRTLEAFGSLRPGSRALIFTNLVDLDMKYGHRRDAQGCASVLAAVDAWLPSLMEELHDRDLVIITADHGCDPTTPSTDHSREYVPLLVFGPCVGGGTNLGTRKTFSDIGATLAQGFGLGPAVPGRSFLSSILA